MGDLTFFYFLRISELYVEEELESDVFGCCGEGAGVVEVPGIIGSWHANITKTIQRLSRYFRFDFNLIYSFLCFLKVNQSESTPFHSVTGT